MPNLIQSKENIRTVLYQTSSFEVVSIEWSQENKTQPHHHGWSQCMVLVENGVFENTLFTGLKSEIQTLDVGSVLNTPIGAKHEMRCLSSKGRTLHIYTPKIVERADLGTFNIDSISALKNNLTLKDSTSIESLKQILESIREHSISTNSPYFMNQLFSGILPQMLMAEDLIAQTKTTMATYEASPAFSTIESEVIEALGELIGWSKNSRDGVGVPGGSAANFMAVHCARQKQFPESKMNGIDGTRLKVFVSAEAHYSFKKACAALGMGTGSVQLVPALSDGCMDLYKLDLMIQDCFNQGNIPLMVCATAGTTVLGAFDPIDQISSVCQKHGLWLHVDGAWGAPVLFSKQSRHLVQGVELADSVTFDAHKLFGASLTCSFFLTQHKGLLLEANDVSGGDYLFHSDDPTLDRGKLSWQCGRKADALSFWTIWKSAGTDGLGLFVDRFAKIRDQIVLWLEMQPRLELIAEPEYLNICVRVRPPEGHLEKARDWSTYVRENLKKKNLAMVNYSANADGSFLRLILAHPFIETEHVQQILQWALDVE